jgi:hypothetical protein
MKKDLEKGMIDVADDLCEKTFRFLMNQIKKIDIDDKEKVELFHIVILTIAKAISESYIIDGKNKSY